MSSDISRSSVFLQASKRTCSRHLAGVGGSDPEVYDHGSALAPS